ncbi:MAG: pyrroline-5-carboxylate reductase [Candidatus Omnitrophica bacterium]|nr:pyrroline-5-carboxylate reductase [Candidatus Omnitrophota bacterium]
MHETIGFIGGGNMATAIIGGLVQKSVYQPQQIYVGEISEERRKFLSTELGVRITGDNAKVIEESSGLVLAIKPQGLADLSKEVANHFPSEVPVVSILAGVTVSKLSESLNGQKRIVRTMPNLPALVGKGVAGIAEHPSCSEEDLRFAEKLLGAVGETVRVQEELMDTVTAVSGSGPGYVFRIADLMIQAGQDAGLTQAQAASLVSQTFYGASELLSSSEESAAELCRKVCSPGGTTLAGLEAMMANGLEKAIEAGVMAARDRSKELSGN